MWILDSRSSMAMLVCAMFSLLGACSLAGTEGGSLIEGQATRAANATERAMLAERRPDARPVRTQYTEVRDSCAVRNPHGSCCLNEIVQIEHSNAGHEEKRAAPADGAVVS